VPFTPSEGAPSAQLADQLAKRFGPASSFVALAPDASTRFFFRLERADGQRRVVMSDPAGGPAALDRMSAARKTLAEIGVRTPAIEDRDDELSALLLEDLGDVLLADALPRMPAAEQLALYEEAGRFAGLIAKQGTARVGRGHPLAFPDLGRERLRAELALFAVQDVAGRRNRSDPALLQALSDFSDKIVQVVGAATPKLAHRDFHSRNLLVLPGPHIGVVDFQDTLLAPPLYDLASLTHDPYITPGAELSRAASNAYAAAAGIDGDPLADRLFPWVTLQRVLKAIGTYAFQARMKERPRFLAYIPPAERLALSAAAALPAEWRGVGQGILLHAGFTT
jgi:hypothetical protein